MRRAEKLEADLTTAQGTITFLQENGATAENVDLAKALATERTKLEQQSRALDNRARSIVVSSLTAQYGIPAEELESLSDPREMQLAAREWALDHPETPQETGEGAAKTPPSNEGPKAAEKKTQEKAETPPPAEEPAENSGFDLGMGVSAHKSVADMSAEEFAAHEQRIESTIAAQASRKR